MTTVSTSDHRALRVASQTLEAILATEVVAYSFPSGHIATTMAAVTVLAENYPEAHWLKPAGYSVTGLVGIGLVNRCWHWYSDLSLGIAIGYPFGTIVSHSDGDMKPDDQGDIKLSFSPVADERGSGLLDAIQS